MPEVRLAQARRRSADQASGLRRLFGERSAQIVAFVSASVGVRRAICGTPLILKAATTLIHNDIGVVVMDEYPPAESVFASFGLAVRQDLIDVLDGRQTASEIVIEGPSGLRLVGASRFAAELKYIDAVAEHRLNVALTALQDGSDFLMIDCAPRANGDISPLAAKAHHVTVLVAPEPAAITQAYLLIKRLAKLRDGLGIHVCVSDAKTGNDARSVFDNLQTTARRHLGVQLNYLGDLDAPATGGLSGRTYQPSQPSQMNANNRSSNPDAGIVSTPPTDHPLALAGLLSVV